MIRLDDAPREGPPGDGDELLDAALVADARVPDELPGVAVRVPIAARRVCITRSSKPPRASKRSFLNCRSLVLGRTKTKCSSPRLLLQHFFRARRTYASAISRVLQMFPLFFFESCAFLLEIKQRCGIFEKILSKFDAFFLPMLPRSVSEICGSERCIEVSCTFPEHLQKNC